MSVIPLSWPNLEDDDIQAVVEVLRSGRLSFGARQTQFEQLVSQRAQCAHGIAVSNATAALHLVLLALGIGPGDEVITTPFSRIATANAILYVGAKPIFVDIDPVSLNMDPKQIESAITPRTKAVLGGEIFGNPIHIEKIAQIAGANDLPLIEDATEALGGMYLNKPTGSFGRVGIFGFHASKQVTTGEGGVIVTDDERLAELVRTLRNHGRPDWVPSGYIHTSHELVPTLRHDRLGYNYRLGEMSAALGVAQMDRLDTILDRRRHIAESYMRRLIDFNELILPTISDQYAEGMSWFAFIIRLANDYGSSERDRIIAGMSRHEVGTAAYYPCIHLQRFYRDQFGYQPGDFPIAESISNRTIALPFHTRLDATALDLIVQTLKVMLQREQLLRQ